MFCFPLSKQISTMLPFLSFLLDFCESWSLAEGEEQSSKNPCSHHEATSARSVHRLCNCWVSCVRSADAAKWKAMEESFFFFFFLIPQDTKYVGTVGVGKGSKSKITNCHLLWQLECRFNVWGQLHLSAKRHSFSSITRMWLQIDVKVLLEQLIGLNVSMLLCTWIGFLRGIKVNMLLFLWCRNIHVGALYTTGHSCFGSRQGKKSPYVLAKM